MVDPNGRLRWPGAAVADHRAMPQWWSRWLEVECNHCKSRASIPLNAIRRARDTPNGEQIRVDIMSARNFCRTSVL
jgi:hypothetical protein